MRRLVVLAALVLLVATACEQRLPLPPEVSRPRVLVTGDSTVAGTVWLGPTVKANAQAILNQHADVTIDAGNCRRLIVTSCFARNPITGVRETTPNVIDVLRARGRSVGQVLVVMGGYDDAEVSRAIDAVMAEATAQGVLRVIWLTYRTTTTYALPGGASAAGLYQRHNAQLRAAAARHPALVIADWDGLTKDKCNLPRGTAENGVCWFRYDGIHLSPTGATGLATWLDQQIQQVWAAG